MFIFAIQTKVLLLLMNLKGLKANSVDSCLVCIVIFFSHEIFELVYDLGALNSETHRVEKTFFMLILILDWCEFFSQRHLTETSDLGSYIAPIYGRSFLFKVLCIEEIKKI